MEGEDNIIVKCAQEDVKTLYNLLNNKMSDTVQTVYELPLLPYYTSWEKFLHKSGDLSSVDWMIFIGAPDWR